MHRLSTAVRRTYDSLRGMGRGFVALPRSRQLAVVVLILAVIAVPLVVDVPSAEQWRSWSETLGPGFVFAFAGIYIVATQFPIPRTVFTLASGVLFGPLVGMAVALGCTTVSAWISLSLVRAFLSDWIRPHLTHPAVATINTHLRRRGWLAVTSLRMIAGIPFSILNYVAALSEVPRGWFTLATLIGSAPGTIATVVLGSALSHGGDARMVMITIALLILGCTGMLIDALLPVRPPSPPQAQPSV
ncbi:SNARE associated Golgi protein [Corynebacterium ciconiae DSM 44920]|uniref:TVP38/TMEM64 family protein n=1 Tax=Corynebacterium ciconiae TaxID=227319 RepID=UPI000375D55C|nr:TVP38/TMEM64 family protein [Corynebacterium ciconiae]WKD61215.1 SNARE associated Golgi protein [Corynebacterium ciconiae DSM 44920]